MLEREEDAFGGFVDELDLGLDVEEGLGVSNLVLLIEETLLLLSAEYRS